MNAYELAEIMMNFDSQEVWSNAKNVANMLRQQADRIAELEKENSELKYEKSSGVYDAEPVAWATEDLEEIMTLKLRQAHIDHPKSCTHKFFPIPLYTTPQTKPLSDDPLANFKPVWQEKYQPLSDEEIKDIWMKRPVGKAEDIFKFARAIEERHGIK